MSECIDDESIPSTEMLWRRISKDVLVVQGGEERPMSGAFMDTRGELSVHLASKTSVELVSQLYPEHGIVEIPASLVRSLELRIMARPTAPDPSHAVVCPRASSSKQSKLKAAARFIRPVPKS